jgi:hypothetical protein
MGKFLGYRVTVCDPRTTFMTRERFPDADELAIEWPDRFLESAPVDARTAICMMTHDLKFDVPALKRALQTNAGYIGAIGSEKTRGERDARPARRGRRRGRPRRVAPADRDPDRRAHAGRGRGHDRGAADRDERARAREACHGRRSRDCPLVAAGTLAFPFPTS